jgi:hypothetical protein
MKEPRLSTVEEVYGKWRSHLERLRDLRDRQGEDFSDLATVQLNGAQEIVDDLGFVLYGSNGHGRILHPERETAAA